MSKDAPEGDQWRISSIRAGTTGHSAGTPPEPGRGSRYPWSDSVKQTYLRESGEMPREVRWANTLMTVVVVWFALGGLIGMARVARNYNEPLGGPSLDTVLFIAFVAIAVITGLMAGLAAQLRAGKNWARIVAIVIFVISAFGGLIGIFTPSDPLDLLTNLVSLAVSVALVALLAGAPARDYFDR